MENTVAKRSFFSILIEATRPYQWTKNILVFAALIFVGDLFQYKPVLLATAAFVVFCLASSATYIFNDLWDYHHDQNHAEKCKRVIASGAMSKTTAWTLLVALLGTSMLLAYFIRPMFLVALGSYIFVSVSYTLFLKHKVILDVLTIAIGFVIRAIAGAVALDVPFSNWLVVCTFCLATFLALGKRRSELAMMEEEAHTHRKTLFHYTVGYLEQLMLIMAAASLLTYTIYSCSPEVQKSLGTDKLYISVPFVVYGLFRYLFIVCLNNDGGDPSRTLLRDIPLCLTLIFWVISCVGVIYF